MRQIGNSPQTGIGLHAGWLYAEAGDRILRWRLGPGDSVPTSQPETIVSGLPSDGEHPMHQFAIDRTGNLFVNVGSATNACEIQMDVPQPKALKPCTELDVRAGVWRFRADKPGQTFSVAGRYATGIRNIGGMRINQAGRLVVTQHGRDSLGQNWSNLYTVEQGAELPAEELLVVREGGDYGWPYCYFDGFQKKHVLAPEYGGDGSVAGQCTRMQAPLASFSAHWAPNDLLLYEGRQFPEAYRHGAFIAFHGSWNRAPLPQEGFRVVFQPIAGGKTLSPPVLFADGFAGKARPDAGSYRPSGLAQGKDGSLFISDDRHGRVWQITYQGSPDVRVEAAQASTYADATDDVMALAALPIPPGRTLADVALGARIFNGQSNGGTCSGCHGTNGAGGGMAPELTSGKWQWSDGSVAGIEKVVRSGVTRAKTGSGGMPPGGGAQLSEADVAAVASYVWAIGHRTRQ